jgi:hypothetical protein
MEANRVARTALPKAKGKHYTTCGNACGKKVEGEFLRLDLLRLPNSPSGAQLFSQAGV